MRIVQARACCLPVAALLVLSSAIATAADASRCLMASARPFARSGTQCKRVDGVTLVRNEGTYRWPGVSFRSVEGETWDLSDAGVIEVTVSNACECAEMIHATVLGRDFGTDRAPARSALVPPHRVRTISVQLADVAYRTDLPVKLTGMRGVIGSEKDALDFSKTTSVDVYHVFGANRHKSAFAVLDIRTRYAARGRQGLGGRFLSVRRPLRTVQA